jgi:hypothetical protein
MNNTNTGGSAFPYENRYEHEGMTLRDYFAAKAMQGIMVRSKDTPLPSVAKYAYVMADEMLKARE